MSDHSIVNFPHAPLIAASPSAMPPFSVADIRKRTHAIQEVMQGVMKEGTHFGTIPGSPKPSLWKAGAEVLCMTFRLAPLLESRVTTDDPEVEWAYSGIRESGNIVTGTCVGFFEVEAVCTIQGYSRETLSRCSARCNNRETRYRGMQLFDIRNTIQKMAEKRAFVSAVLMATGASDIFTQDIEDFPELITGRSHQATPVPKSVEGDDTENTPAFMQPSPTEVITDPLAGATVSQGLSPKRSAWLFRVGQESKVPAEAMDRCMAFLQRAEGTEVKAFFDELARRKGEVFRPFMAA